MSASNASWRHPLQYCFVIYVSRGTQQNRLLQQHTTANCELNVVQYRWQDPLKVESAESGVGVFSAGASFPTHAACAKQCAAKHAV